MTRFVATPHGYINLRHVVEVEREATWEIVDGFRRRKPDDWFLRLRDDRRVRLDSPFEDDDLGKDVILASSHALFLVTFWVDQEGVLSERVPIIAWKVNPAGYPTPIAVGTPTEGSWAAVNNTHQFVELPDGGGFYEVGWEGSYFADLDAVRKYVGERPREAF